MKFTSKNHQALFNEMANKLGRHNRVKMSVLYLLTADGKLWNASKHHIRHGHIDLEGIRVKKCSEKSYALLCCAKDLAFGTAHICVYDLADMDIITPKLYGTIITAIGIRRNGIQSPKTIKKENENDQTNA